MAVALIERFPISIRVLSYCGNGKARGGVRDKCLGDEAKECTCHVDAVRLHNDSRSECSTAKHFGMYFWLKCSANQILL